MWFILDTVYIYLRTTNYYRNKKKKVSTLWATVYIMVGDCRKLPEKIKKNNNKINR